MGVPGTEPEDERGGARGIDSGVNAEAETRLASSPTFTGFVALVAPAATLAAATRAVASATRSAIEAFSATATEGRNSWAGLVDDEGTPVAILTVAAFDRPQRCFIVVDLNEGEPARVAGKTVLH